MKAEQLEKILDGVTGVRKEGAAWHFAEETELTLHLALASEVLTVARVSRYERAGDLAAVETHAGDRYHFLGETIAIVKIGGASRRSPKTGAGFR